MENVVFGQGRLPTLGAIQSYKTVKMSDKIEYQRSFKIEIRGTTYGMKSGRDFASGIYFKIKDGSVKASSWNEIEGAAFNVTMDLSDNFEGTLQCGQKVGLSKFRDGAQGWLVNLFGGYFIFDNVSFRYIDSEVHVSGLLSEKGLLECKEVTLDPEKDDPCLCDGQKCRSVYKFNGEYFLSDQYSATSSTFNFNFKKIKDLEAEKMIVAESTYSSVDGRIKGEEDEQPQKGLPRAGKYLFVGEISWHESAKYLYKFGSKYFNINARYDGGNRVERVSREELQKLTGKYRGKVKQVDLIEEKESGLLKYVQTIFLTPTHVSCFVSLFGLLVVLKKADFKWSKVKRKHKKAF
ncbi:hypothetical protein ACFLY6_02075, partial [Candidatus Dependentiae bacterium]